jgi:hypothetical protein
VHPPKHLGGRRGVHHIEAHHNLHPFIITSGPVGGSVIQCMAPQSTWDATVAACETSPSQMLSCIFVHKIKQCNSVRVPCCVMVPEYFKLHAMSRSITVKRCRRRAMWRMRQMKMPHTLLSLSTCISLFLCVDQSPCAVMRSLSLCNLGLTLHLHTH